MRIIAFLFKSLFVLLGILLGILVIGLGFLAIGWVFSQLFSLSQYEATIIALGTGSVLIFLVSRFLQLLTVEMPEEEEEEEEEEYEFEIPPSRRVARELKRKRRRR